MPFLQEGRMTDVTQWHRTLSTDHMCGMYRVVTAKHILRAANLFWLAPILGEKELTPLPRIFLQYEVFLEATAVEHIPCMEAHPTQSSLYGLRITGEDLREKDLALYIVRSRFVCVGQSTLQSRRHSSTCELGHNRGKQVI